MDALELARARSLAYHREIARRLREDPGLLDEARARAERWAASAGRSAHLAARWRQLLDRGIASVLEVLEDPGEEAEELRHASPFAGMIDPRARWRIWREVRDGAPP
jgi:hypothetical protein